MNETQIKEVLKNSKTIAMIGVSNDQNKASTIVMKYMQKYGFKVFPVNPKAKGQTILGEKVFEKITDIKEDEIVVEINETQFILNLSEVAIFSH